MKSQVMFRTLPSHRYQRSKGLRVKHVVQLVTLVIVVTWISFQLKHSQRNTSVPTRHKTERGRDFLVEKSVDWKLKEDGNLLGRKGGNVHLDAHKHQEQIEVENKIADPDDVSEKEQEEEDDNIEENINLEMNATDNPVILNEETEIARESLDEVDEDDDVDAGNRGIGDDKTTENDNLTEDFFNEGIDTREDIENVPSEVDAEQINSEDGTEDEYIESEISQFQSETNKQEFTDFEGEESVTDRNAGESQHIEHVKEGGASDLKESIQNSFLSDGTIDPGIRTARDIGSSIGQTEVDQNRN